MKQALISDQLQIGRAVEILRLASDRKG
jgi:hypothetical protein